MIQFTMPSSWFSFVGSLLLLAALPARGATLVEKSIDVEIRPDGSTIERTRLSVRLENAGDLDEWSPYPLYFDEHRTIEDVSAWAVTPDGKTLKVGRKDLDTMEVAGSGELHSSQKLRTVRFPAVPAGSVLTLESTVKEQPYFRAGGIDLGESVPVERLRVSVRGGGSGWRWRIDGPQDGLSVQESPGGVVITAASLPARESEDYAPGSVGPVLRYAWGPEASWAAVGRWYTGILGPVPRDAEAVRQKARELTAGVEGRRERLATLLGWVRKQVRYVAVEVGVGGYRPFPPAEVMARKWGDCKDKAVLLIDMLREAGIESYPVLIRLADDDRIDAGFPAQNQFNHLIVAVPAAGLAQPGDPVAGGYLFLDPTQTTGSLRWLHPGVQDQDALVVTPQGGTLVRTPLLADLEGIRMDVRMNITPEGEGRGDVRLEIAGDIGATFILSLGGSRPEEVEHVVRSLLGGLMPAADIQKLQWTTAEDDVPTLTITADLRLAGLMPGTGAARSFSLPGTSGIPAASLVEDRKLPVVLSPGIYRATWRLSLPEGKCQPQGDPVTVENAVGTFRQTVTADGSTVEVGRSLEIRRRWVEPEGFAPLKELSLAESRASKRRIRMECGG